MSNEQHASTQKKHPKQNDWKQGHRFVATITPAPDSDTHNTYATVANITTTAYVGELESSWMSVGKSFTSQTLANRTKQYWPIAPVKQSNTNVTQLSSRNSVTPASVFMPFSSQMSQKASPMLTHRTGC